MQAGQDALSAQYNYGWPQPQLHHLCFGSNIKEIISRLGWPGGEHIGMMSLSKATDPEAERARLEYDPCQACKQHRISKIIKDQLLAG